jgi:acyl-CoA thioester hydrolase
MESARMEYFVKIGFMKMKKTVGIGPILASTSCRFKGPLSYPDIVSVGTNVTKIEEFGFIMGFSIVSHKTNRQVATGEAGMISYDYNTNKKVPLPAELVKNIKELENEL